MLWSGDPNISRPQVLIGSGTIGQKSGRVRDPHPTSGKPHPTRNRKIDNKMYKKLAYLLQNRFLLFGLFLFIFICLQLIFFNTFLPSTENEDLWFYSGIFMVLFSVLFIEPYFTSPKNVITNAIPLILVLLAIRNSFVNTILWWAAIIIIGLLIIASILAISIEDNNKSPDYWKNQLSVKTKNIVVVLGQGRVLYSTVFIYFLITYHSIQNLHTLLLFILWFFILAINPKRLHNDFSLPGINNKADQIGEIFSVQSKKTFLVKLFDDRKTIKDFDPVKFKYSMQDTGDQTTTGIVLDTYLLNQEKWAKVLQLGTSKQEDTNSDKNIVSKITEPVDIQKLNDELNTSNLVGVIIDGSTIGKIRFEYHKKDDNLMEGDLLELRIFAHRLFYQVINGCTEKERLEARNETGFIVGDAIQLGEWCKEKFSFQKFGWVPTINTPVFKTNASDIEVEKFSYPNFQLGLIPGTKLPAVIDLHQAISHHMSLLGVTGSGKSFLAREIINQIIQDTKVICIDFNKEFSTTLTPSPSNIISDPIANEISIRIDWINNELDEFPNRQDKNQIAAKQTEIKKYLRDEIEKYLDDKSCNLKIFELPDVSNTLGILDYTKYFFKVVFETAKDKLAAKTPIKICIVLEEAHTVIPEWNFTGISEKASQSLVNSIGQIALQGRKYGVGFLVIAQRTANVSKTVLTQCNTVVCFQAFDETSFNFLGNYVGKEMVQTLPNLKQYHAIVAGKAMKSNFPLIIDLTRQT